MKETDIKSEPLQGKTEYDFDKAVERRRTGSMKWDVGDDELPMWVADMDFQTAPEVIKAIEKRAEHGVFGYCDVDDDWYDAYISWWQRRHGLKMEKEWLMFSTGVIPTISSAVRKLTTPNENVLLLTPVYNIFFNSIVNNGARALESPLKFDGEAYEIDWEDLERKLRDPQTTLMLFCNPHNPVGKVWDRSVIARIGELAYENHVTVVSDEIHCDLTVPGVSYTPFISVSDKCRQVCIMAISPTKAFNLAGIQTSAVCVPDPVLRHKVRRAINTDEVAEPNVFAPVAAVAAFNKGGVWLDALSGYLYANRKRVTGFMEDLAQSLEKESLPAPRLIPGEATYLLWIDMREFEMEADELQSAIRNETGLFLSTGSIYGKGGEHFLRMNIACPRALLEDGLRRFSDFCFHK